MPAVRSLGTPNVWQAVQPKDETHARAGQAGIVHATNPDKPDECAVKWDVDQAVTVEKVADLNTLQA